MIMPAESKARMLLCGLLIALISPLALLAKEKKDQKKELPSIKVAIPLGISRGKPQKVTIRGLRLDEATELRFKEPKTTAKILAKTKAGVPNGLEANQIGDSQVEAEVVVPPDFAGESIEFVIVTAAGESHGHQLLVDHDKTAVAEKEPNNGFAQAQQITVPEIINGVIDHPQDVDVFRFEGKAGQRIVCEVRAAKLGSALDSIVTLFDANGHTLISNDDYNGSADSLVDFELPKSGAYFLSVMDANDQGSPAHSYRLTLRQK
jgi:hypothetical protein